MLHIQSRILQRLFGYPHRELRVAVELAHLFAVEQGRWVKTLHLAGELGLKEAGIKGRDRSYTALAGHQGFPCLSRAIAYGRKRAYSCYNDSS